MSQETAATTADERTSLPWSSIPRFVPGTTDVTEYSKKLQFLASIWPKEHLPSLAPRAALLCEGTAFKKITRLNAEKLKATDTSGVELLVKTLGGSWGQTVLEAKYEHFERAIYGTIQKNDETNDSYLARSDVCFEELLAQQTTFEELRAYVLLRQSQLSADDKKKIVIEHQGKLSYEQVCASIRLLGSRFFNDLQGHRTATRSKVYDAFQAEEELSDRAEGSSDRQVATANLAEDAEYDLDPDFVETMVAQEDSDAIHVAAFEADLEEFFQETPEMQTALVSYLEARHKLREKQRNRGFWPVKGQSGRKGKGFSKGRGKGKRDREALLQRIARSHCRLCGRKGHWRAECPDAKDKEIPAGVAATTEAADDEICSNPPGEALLIASEEPLFTTVEVGKHDIRRRTFVTTDLDHQRLLKFALRRSKPDTSGIPDKKTLAHNSLSLRTKPLLKATWSECPVKAKAPCTLAQGLMQNAFASITEDGRIEAIVDTGASRCVLGKEFLSRFLQQLHREDRRMVCEMPSAVRFRFGNNQTLVSEKKIYLPIGGPGNKIRWLMVEVVPGKTPLLFSKRALKQLGGILDLENDKVNLSLPLHTNPFGLYLLDIASLGPHARKRDLEQHPDKVPSSQTMLASMHVGPKDSRPREGVRNPQDNSTCEVSIETSALVNDQSRRAEVPEILSPTLRQPQQLTPPERSVQSSSVYRSSIHRVISKCHHGTEPQPRKSHSTAADLGGSLDDAVCQLSSGNVPGDVPVDGAKCRYEPDTGHHGADATGDAQTAGDVGCSDQTAPAEPTFTSGFRSLNSTSFKPKCVRYLGFRRSGEADCWQRIHGSHVRPTINGQVLGRSTNSGADDSSGAGANHRPGSRSLGSRDRQLGNQAQRFHIPPCHHHGLRILHMDVSARQQLGNEHPSGLLSQVLPHHAESEPGLTAQEAQNESSVLHAASLEAIETLQTCLADSRVLLDKPENSQRPSPLPEVDRCEVQPVSSFCPVTESVENPLSRDNINRDSVGPHVPSNQNYPNLISLKKGIRNRFKRRAQRLDTAARLTDQSAEVLLSLENPEVGDLVLEVFTSSQSRLTQKFRELGHKASRFTREDGDLATSAGQEALWQRIRTLKPYHVFVSPDCGSWCNWSHLNMARSPLTAAKIRLERERQRKILKLCSQLCEYQVGQNRHFTMEHPRGSMAWKQSELQPMIRVTKAVDFEMCAFNLRLHRDSPLLRKGTTLRSTSLEILISLRNKRCLGDHKHQRIEGTVSLGAHKERVRLSSWTASYCPQFVHHLCKVMGSGPHRRTYDLTSEAYPTEQVQEKTSEPPLTRKRQKTSVGRLSTVAFRPSSGRKRANGEEEPSMRDAKQSRTDPGIAEDSDRTPNGLTPNGTSIASPHLISDRTLESWKAAFQTIKTLLPNRGTARVPGNSPHLSTSRKRYRI